MTKCSTFHTKHVLLILMVIIIVTLYYYDKENRKKYVLQLLKPLNTAAIQQSGTFCLKSLDIQLRRCLVTSLFERHSTVWASLADAINQCSKVLRKSLRILTLENNDDFKYVILPRLQDAPCFVLTVGIGNDIAAEEQLKSLKPNCRFFGVDPVFESGYKYTLIGQYLQMAVSHSSDNKSISGHVLIENQYLEKRIKSINFFTLLNSTGVSLIDYMFFDAEGAEYSVLPLLTKTRYHSNVRICQISIELHGIDYKYSNITHERFDAMIFDLLQNSAYLPVLNIEWGFLRMFWIDFQSTECVSKYFSNFCTENFDRFHFLNFADTDSSFAKKAH